MLRQCVDYKDKGCVDWGQIIEFWFSVGGFILIIAIVVVAVIYIANKIQS